MHTLKNKLSLLLCVLFLASNSYASKNDIDSLEEKTIDNGSQVEIESSNPESSNSENINIENSSALDSSSNTNEETNLQAIIIDYTVQTGDTLSSLSNEYLGDSSLWRKNAEINPELENFNVLEPGSTIRLITGYAEPEPEVIASQATIVLKSNQVNKSLQGGDWSDATQGEEIFSGDGLRTLRESSALLEFSNEDETQESDQVQVYENSVIFIREEPIENSKAKRNEIEIEKGTAQIELSTPSKDSDEQLNQYEVNVGGVITVPTIGEDGKSSTKARIDETAGSQIMVYNGSSSVESAGISVAVETGMGTTAKAGEAPAEPEKLLTSPMIDSANPSASEVDTSVAVNWQALEGANHYRLNLCADNACKTIIQSINNIKETTHTLTSLNVGDWFWQVTAVSPSGLDGFPSKSQSLNIFKPEPVVEEEIDYVYVLGLIVFYYLLSVYFINFFSGRKLPHTRLFDAIFKN